jgi:CHAD domain-containing protein
MAVAERADDLQHVLEQQLDELEAKEPGTRAGDAEALHDFRVATRRSRALLRPCSGVDELQRELRWLAGLLGPVRDLDVLIEHVAGLVAQLDGDREGGEELLLVLVAQRDDARRELYAGLDSERYQALLVRFRDELPRLGGTDGARLRRVAARELRRLERARADLAEDPADAELHRVRIKAKRTRYAAELAARSGGKRLKRLAEAAKDLQDVIGLHQDAVVAETRIRAAAATAPTLLAAGRIIEIERERRRDARSKLPKLWKRLDRAAAKAF